jgi:hypothetical protein
MNQGIFGFPNGPDSRLISVKEFDISGYLIKLNNLFHHMKILLKLRFILNL